MKIAHVTLYTHGRTCITIYTHGRASELIERISWLCYKFNSFIISDWWLENLTVANKSITLLPYIKEYCNQAALNKTEPKEHAGYQSVKKAINEDKLLKAKHLFWISLA